MAKRKTTIVINILLCIGYCVSISLLFRYDTWIFQQGLIKLYLISSYLTHCPMLHGIYSCRKKNKAISWDLVITLYKDESQKQFRQEFSFGNELIMKQINGLLNKSNTPLSQE